MLLLLQFHADTFETLQVFRLWSEDVHIVWILKLFINLHGIMSCRFFFSNEITIYTIAGYASICAAIKDIPI